MSERRRLSVVRRAIFTTLVFVLFTALVEGGARLYGAIKYRNSVALRHGAKFLRATIDGNIRYQEEFPFVDIQEQARTADWMFANRTADDPDVQMPQVPPSETVVAGASIRLNSFGLRRREVAFEPAAGVRRIAVLGGSFVFGWGLTDAEVWPRLVESRLNASARRVEVVNAGLGGANINNVLAMLIRLSAATPIDEAIVASSYNDHQLLHIQRRVSLVTKADFYLYNLSWFYVMCKERIGLLRRQPVDYGGYRQRVHVEAADVEPWLALYRRRLAQIAAVCRERRLALFGEPEMFFDNTYNAMNLVDDHALDAVALKIRAGHDLRRMELEYFLQGSLNREMQRFAAAHDVPFFDGGDVFPPDKRAFFLDQIHPNRFGSSRIAERLTEFLQRMPPAEPRERHHHDLQGALVDGETTHLAPDALVSNMRRTNEAWRGVRTSLATNDLTDVGAGAARLRILLEENESFWRSRSNSDAVAAARAGGQAALNLHQATIAGDESGARAATWALGASCKMCHDAHRQRLGDGRSGIR